MSRKKSGAGIVGWLSARADCKEGRFIQVENSLLLSQQYQDLTAMESGGKREFVFPLSTAKKYGIAKNSLWRNIVELQNAGFINIQSSASIRQPNLYSFSFEWKSAEAAR